MASLTHVAAFSAESWPKWLAHALAFATCWMKAFQEGNEITRAWESTASFSWLCCQSLEDFRTSRSILRTFKVRVSGLSWKHLKIWRYLDYLCQATLNMGILPAIVGEMAYERASTWYSNWASPTSIDNSSADGDISLLCWANGR